ncbi:hypothetical protein Bbelb_040190 [Branchiostoma belcheri]|nr:hypothetical protein Bbelb_040190 [Branchiostoma belcheri]
MRAPKPTGLSVRTCRPNGKTICDRPISTQYLSLRGNHAVAHARLTDNISRYAAVFPPTLVPQRGGYVLTGRCSQVAKAPSRRGRVSYWHPRCEMGSLLGRHYRESGTSTTEEEASNGPSMRSESHTEPLSPTDTSSHDEEDLIKNNLKMHQVFVKDLQGKTRCIDVQEGSTVAELMVLLETEKILPPGGTLIAGSRKLKKTELMGDVPSNIEVVLGLCGGAPGKQATSSKSKSRLNVNVQQRKGSKIRAEELRQKIQEECEIGHELSIRQLGKIVSAVYEKNVVYAHCGRKGKRENYYYGIELKVVEELQSLPGVDVESSPGGDLHKSRGAPLFKALFKGAPLFKALFKGAPLFKALFKGMPLFKALFKGAPLFKALFKGAPLFKALFKGMPLFKALFKGAPLFKALFRGAPLFKALFKGVPLFKALFKGAPLFKALFKGTPLFKALFKGAPLFKALFKGMPLFKALFKGAPLFKALFRGAPLFKALFKGAPLFKALFKGMPLFKAFILFKGAPLFKALFRGAPLFKALFKGAPLFKALFKGMPLFKALFKGASLFKALFRGAPLFKALFKGAPLFKALFKGAP